MDLNTVNCGQTMSVLISRDGIIRSKSLIFLGLSLAVLAASGCTKSSNSTSTSGASVIRIGEVGSLTGADATFGESTHKGIQLAVKQINSTGGIKGRQLELLTLDDQGKPSEAVLAITKLISQQKVSAVLGEVASTLSIAMAGIAQKSQIPMITPSSLNLKVTKQGNYVFRVCFVDVFQAQVMADFAYDDLKARKVALLRDTKSDYSQDNSIYFADFFKKRGGKIVIDQSYTAGDIDFQSQLTAIRAAQPDVIWVPGYYTDIGLIARQAAGLGIKAPLLGGDGWDSPLLGQIGGRAIEGSYYAGHFMIEDSNPNVQSFVKDYKAAYGEVPNSLAALGYDAALLLGDALKRSASDKSEDLRTAIAATKDFAGVTGTISINSDRNAVKKAVVFRVSEGGKLRVARVYEPK